MAEATRLEPGRSVSMTGTSAKDEMLSLDETKLERRSLARGELLFGQGDKVQAIYFV
jgi:hypothetical protein